MSLNGKDLARFASTMIGTPYVYGAKLSQGKLTQARVNSLAKAYPNMFTQSYLNKIASKKLVGKLCVDCSGLISGYTKKEYGSSQLYSIAKKRMPYKDFRNFAIGTVLWRQGHVGVYCGQDEKGNYYCIEAKGIDHGTVKSILTDSTKWTYGLTFDFMEYEYTQKVSGTSKQTNPYKEPNMNVAKGNKGDHVKWVQFELIEAGYGKSFKYNGKTFKAVIIDGDAGDITDAAIRSFQASCKLKVDGICGQDTRRALIKN